MVVTFDALENLSVKCSRGPKDLENDMGLVNFFKLFGLTPPPLPPKKGNSRKNISHFITYQRCFQLCIILIIESVSKLCLLTFINA